MSACVAPDVHVLLLEGKIEAEMGAVFKGALDFLGSMPGEVDVMGGVWGAPISISCV